MKTKIITTAFLAMIFALGMEMKVIANEFYGDNNNSADTTQSDGGESNIGD
ncbi:MAG: hypothetical protein JSS34_04265 [Proteobacteria bacterium]|nr:hypothetical protein [Pseudomonadota bacterium]